MNYPHLLKVQIVMSLLVAIGGYVLGNSISDQNIIVVTLIGTILSFILVDRLNWIELSGWTANIFLIGILIYTMKDFVGGDSAAKLTSVATLLSYLLVALCFQKKSPRLCWQILALSILQMLEAAIFNLNFEYGILFGFYFLLSSLALVLQFDYSSWTSTKVSNEKNSGEAKLMKNSGQIPTTLSPMLVAITPSPTKTLLEKFLFLIPWLACSLIFSFALFHSLPHSRQDWSNNGRSDFSLTGRTKSVDLSVDGVVSLSSKLVLRARFRDLNTDDNIIVVGEPYFRGMSLSKFVFENGETSWTAPYDHVFVDESYSGIRRFRNARAQNNVRLVKVEIVIEPTDDPLLYGVFPAFRKIDGESDVEICHELSALTRRKSNVGNTIASYKYDLTTLLDSVNRPLDGFPYRSPDENFPEMETGSPEFQLLTEMERKHFPGLIRIAEDLAKSSTNSRDLCQSLLNHFSQRNGYQYTLDYRNVSRSPEIDPVEDFVSNHRFGHCELYASALVLMLRSQGIPARYVVGFYGGNYNSLTDCYVIHGRHAHAWVEAYIPPHECTEEMFDLGIAGERSGAWIKLDPTPLIGDDDQGNEALDLARTIWQDYVISPDQNKQGYNEANSLFLTTASGTRLEEYLEMSVESLNQNRLTQGSLLLLIVVLILYPVFQRRIAKSSTPSKTNRTPFRQFIANAISIVSPRIANWVSGKSKSQVSFYLRFEQIIADRLGLERESGQTQREFANLAAEQLSQRKVDSMEILVAQKLLFQITDVFYQARFSPIPLDKPTVDNIENEITNLDKILSLDKS